MIFTFSIRDFGHPKFLKSQFGHHVMKILAKSLEGGGGVLLDKNSCHTFIESPVSLLVIFI